MNLLWLVACAAGASLYGAPKGALLLMVTCRFEGNLQIWGQVPHWYNLELSPLEAHQPPTVEICPRFAFGTYTSAASPKKFK